jgi:hypothetical protein
VIDGAKSYKTAGVFRAALETRLQTRASEQGTNLQRIRRQVAFDRFLARMFSKGPKATYPWVLKGGYAMELRTHSARTTKDIDLTLHEGARLSRDPKERGEQVRAMLQEAAATPFNDYLEFLVGEAREDLDGAPEGGSRYPVQSRNGWTRPCALSCRRRCWRRSARASGGRHRRRLAWLRGSGAAVFPVISAEQQFAEKLHGIRGHEVSA